MTPMNLPHFPAMIVFAFIISVAFSLLAKETFAERIKYAAWTLLAFLVVGIALGWLMYPFGR